jgi:hypothetical protein
MAPSLRACSLAAMHSATITDPGIIDMPARKFRTLRARGGGPGNEAPRRTTRKLASVADMGGSATRPVVATPEPAGRAIARTMIGAPPMCRIRRRGIAAGIQAHRDRAASAHDAERMNTRATKTRKKPVSGRLARRPLLTALLNTQQAADIRRSGFQGVALDATAMPDNFPVARDIAHAATRGCAGEGSPRTLGGPDGGATRGIRRACTVHRCHCKSSNQTQEHHEPSAPHASRGCGVTAGGGGIRVPWPLRRPSPRARVPPGPIS